MTTPLTYQKFEQLPIVQEIFSVLKARLPKSLRYHTFDHNIDVFHEVLLFGEQDHLTPRQLELLAIGAAYHDSGFIDSLKENEAIGARYAEAAMRKFGGYSEDEILTVKTIILDTMVRITESGPRQVPTTELSRYLCDADVSNLGRDDFFHKAELVREEVGVTDHKLFLQGLEKFLMSHQWYTAGAKKLRQSKKEANLADVRKLLKTMG